ncbi:hypothetical protein ACFOY4_29840 [Actinomadura syzygii]|uniref:Uncharacterized protein n=1 Tax=Actinomadura syzygii TaxID=1427538 RepID=A0A5D0TT19_9ACTN|nr:hypothetical protein [Actinomadura syzygii]TYC09471.1 hypothetical protein FXF65_35115 [Actinomadura syzygii]
MADPREPDPREPDPREPERREPARGGRRRFDPAGPVTGLFFLALAGVFLADGLSDRSPLDATVLVPVVLIGLGLVGTVRVLTRGRRRDLR